jgi:hypothetical protein
VRRTHARRRARAHTHTRKYIYLRVYVYIIRVHHFSLITVLLFFGSAYFALPYQGYLGARGLDPTIKCIVSVGTRFLEGITDNTLSSLWLGRAS